MRKKNRSGIIFAFLFLIPLLASYPKGVQEDPEKYHAFDYETIYRSAQQIKENTLYRVGASGGMKIISENPKTLGYIPNRYYAMNDQHDKLLLFTVDGKEIDLSATINGELEKYYRKAAGGKSPDNQAQWGIFSVVDDIYCAGDFQRDDDWSAALVDLSANKQSVYFLKVMASSLFLPLLLARDIVIDSANIYTVGFWGEVTVFAIKDNFLQYEKDIPWQDCRIPGWKGGERLIIDDEDDGTVSAYDFASGSSRILGKRIKQQWSYNGIFYEDENGRSFISGRDGKAWPWLGEGYDFIDFFEKGYIYADRARNSIIICSFENGELTRKTIIACENIIPDSGNYALTVYKDKLYLGMKNLACTIDLNTMQVIKAFSIDGTGNDTPGFVLMFPFGEDDVVYAKYLDVGIES
jgi:hypothetical protein